MRYILQLNYKGTRFNGWQRQKNAIGVQQVIEAKLKILLKEKIEITGAGRTDTGVHAHFYVAHFDTKKNISDKYTFLKRLNGLLPQDIAIEFIKEIDAEFHSRYSALQRTYHYYIHTAKNPFLNEFSVFSHYNLDVEKMNEASKLLLDYQDFASFHKTNSSQKTTICTVYEAYWSNENTRLRFRITANRFLRTMVRTIVGTLIDVGRGKFSVSDFRRIIEAKNRKVASLAAPPEGLFLVDVVYPEPYNSIFVRRKLPIDF